MDQIKRVKSEDATPSIGRGKRRAEEVLNAAASVFADKGFAATATQDIADVLGMRQASLYYYFDSKESALEKVCTVGVMDMIGDAEAVVRATASSGVKLERLIVAHVEMMERRAAFVRVFLHERHHLRDARRRRVRRLAGRVEAIFADVFEQGIRSGEFRAGLDARVATLMVLGMLNTATRWYDKSHEVTLEGLGDQLRRLVMDGVRCGPAIDVTSEAPARRRAKRRRPAKPSDGENS